GGYFTSSTTSGWPTYSVFTTRRGAVPLTYITNGTRDPVTAMWYAWNVPAGTTTFSCAPTLNVSSFTVPSLGEKKFTAKLFPGSSGNAGTEKATASSSIVPGGSTVSMSNGLVVPSGCGVALRPFTLPPVQVKCVSLRCPCWIVTRSSRRLEPSAGSSTSVTVCWNAPAPRLLCSV